MKKNVLFDTYMSTLVEIYELGCKALCKNYWVNLILIECVEVVISNVELLLRLY